MRTLVRSLSGVDPHVPPELAQLHCSVLTLRALVGSLLGVPVPLVSLTLPGGREPGITVPASVRLYPKVSVEMVEDSYFCFELSGTLRTLMRSVPSVTLAMSGEEVAL